MVKRLPKRIILALLLIIVLTAGLVIFAKPLLELVDRGAEAKNWLASTGYAAPAIFTLFTAILTAFGLPRLVFCSFAGLAFGFTWGFVWSHLGTLLGAYGTFLFTRWSGRDYILHKFPKLGSWSAPLEERGWVKVLIMRQMPVSGLYNDILLGLSKVSHLDFWIGSFLGFLPLGVAATLTGAGVIMADMKLLAQYCMVVAAISISLSLLTRYVRKRYFSLA